MDKKIIFKGTATALITPFSDGKIDYSAFEKLIELQIEAKIPALVVGGTTGEAATLNDTERYELYRFAKSTIKDRAKLILGTGTNDTRVAIKHTVFAEELGCDAALVVTPYYNKGTDEGLIRHYLAIAESTNLPIILYNVPTRTGVNLSFSQLSKLARVKNIIAIKEASDSIERLTDLSVFGKELALYSGSDSAIYATLASGGMGVISVISNFYPRMTQSLCEAYFAGNNVKALAIQQRLLPFIKAVFAETNPAPIKYALSKIGLCENELRLPMSCATAFTEKLIDEAMVKDEF